MNCSIRTTVNLCTSNKRTSSDFGSVATRELHKLLVGKGGRGILLTQINDTDGKSKSDLIVTQTPTYSCRHKVKNN